MRVLFVSIIVLFVPAFSVAYAGSKEVDFPCRQIWTADVQRILGPGAEPFGMSADNCVIKVGTKFPIAIWTDPVKKFRRTLAERKNHPKTLRVTRVPLGDEGYALDQSPDYIFLFRQGQTMYEVLVSRLVKLSPAKRLALAKAVARKARGAPNTVIS